MGSLDTFLKESSRCIAIRSDIHLREGHLGVGLPGASAQQSSQHRYQDPGWKSASLPRPSRSSLLPGNAQPRNPKQAAGTDPAQETSSTEPRNSRASKVSHRVLPVTYSVWFAASPDDRISLASAEHLTSMAERSTGEQPASARQPPEAREEHLWSPYWQQRRNPRRGQSWRPLYPQALLASRNARTVRFVSARPAQDPSDPNCGVACNRPRSGASLTNGALSYWIQRDILT